MDAKTLRTLGIIVTVASAAISVVSDIISDKQMEAMIKKEVVNVLRSTVVFK